jgi:hypothetical protein
MKCSQCGSDVAPGATACANCGAPQPTYAPQGGADPYAPQGGGNPYGAQGGGNPYGAQGGGNAGPGGWPQQPGMPGAPAPASFNFDAGRWTRADQITGGASLLLLISLFLPWYTISVSAQGLNIVGLAQHISFSGTRGHGYLWIVFFISLIILAFLVMQAGYQRLPFTLPVPPERVLLGLTGLNLLLVLLAFLVKTGTESAGGISVSVGWGFGAFLGVICAIAAFVPLVLPMARQRAAAR